MKIPRPKTIRLKSGVNDSTPKSKSLRKSITAQQVERARVEKENAKASLERYQRQYNEFMNTQMGSNDKDFLNPDPIADEQLKLQRKIYQQNYEKALAYYNEKEVAHQKLSRQFIQQKQNEESDQYKSMDLDDLQTLTNGQRDQVEKRQQEASAAQTAYGLYMNKAMSEEIDFLNPEPTKHDEEKQEELLNNAYAAQDTWTEERERLYMMEDIGTFRNDMQIISRMSEADKLVLAMHSSPKSSFAFLNALTPEERQLLRDTGRYYEILMSPGNYLKNKGFTGEELDRLSESYTRYQNEQNMLQVRKNADSYAEEDPFWSTVSTYPASFAGEITGGLTAMGDTIQHTLGFSNYHSLDTNKPGYMPTVYSDTTRQAVSEDFTQIQHNAYDTTNNIVDEALTTAAFYYAGKLADSKKIREVGERVFDALGTYGDVVHSSAENGLSNNESFVMAAANAGLHWLTSGIDIDEVVGAKNWAAWEQLRKRYWKGVEKITEDELNYIGNLVIQAAILSENNDFKEQVDELVQTGMSEEEAKTIVFAQYYSETADAYSYALGFLAPLE